ncbi:MAG: HD domain-containing protein [Clostridia bacterium]|nr:HD domain-containing protein [Clostridia bacterium]
MNTIELSKAVSEKIAEYGGKAYYVGGYVRDMIMCTTPQDIDIEVHGLCEEKLEDILTEFGEVIKYGANFGVFSIRSHNMEFSIPRSIDKPNEPDPYIGEEKASLRRDFTCNSLMQNILTGEVLDFFHGTEDIYNKVIRAVSEDTFISDPLRVLRMARFASVLDFTIDEHTLYFASQADLSAIAKERVFKELSLTLTKSEKPGVFFEILRDCNQLGFRFPELQKLIGTEQNPQFHPEGDVWNHTMLVLNAAAELRTGAKNPLAFMLSALMHDYGKPSTTEVIDGRIRSYGHDTKGVPIVSEAMKRLTDDKNLNKYVKNMVRHHMRPNMLAAQMSSQKAYNKLFDESVCPEDLILLAKADHFGRTVFTDYTETEHILKEKLSAFRELMSMPYVTGDDLISNGIVPNEYFSEILAYAHKLRLSGIGKEAALKDTLAYSRKFNRQKKGSRGN